MSTRSDLPLFDDPVSRRELLAVAGFLAGYGVSTRGGYATDLRLFAIWCHEYDLSLFEVQRSHLELYARSLEARGLMPATIARRLSALTSFYRYCEQEALVDRSPAQYVRRPKVDNESRTRAWTATNSPPSWSKPASAPTVNTPSPPSWR